MKVFLVRVGRETRGGNFQELHSHAVSVADEATISDVKKYFTPRYKGFSVIIEQPVHEDIPTKPETKRECGIISGFRIKYTEPEKLLYDEYKELIEKSEKKLRLLHESIIERYMSLPYVKTGIELRTETGWRTDGTFCNRIPIRSGDFFKVIKDCDDGTAELEIVANTNDDDSPDIPF